MLECDLGWFSTEYSGGVLQLDGPAHHGQLFALAYMSRTLYVNVEKATAAGRVVDPFVLRNIGCIV